MPARFFDSDALLRVGRNRAVQALIGVAFVFYLAYHLTRFRVATVWPLAPVGDASIVFDAAKNIFANPVYPDIVFPYSPSAVMLFRALGAAGPSIFMLIWYALMVAGLIVSVRAALAQERFEVRAAWPLIGAIAVLLTDSPIRWDLRNANNNLIYLGLVMTGYGLARSRPLLVGTLIGLSVSLKLYSGLLIGWVLVNGPRRVFYAGAIAMAVLWIVLPVVLFGVGGTVQLYAGWTAQVARLGDPSFHAYLAAQQSQIPITTLQKAIVNITGDGFHSLRVYVLVWLLRAIWIAMLLWYAWRCRHCLFVAVPSRAALADWTVLLLAPLPFSPWLEPYHAIPLLIGAVLCTATAIDASTERRDRWAALAAMASVPLIYALRVPFPIRGLGMFAQFLVLTVILGMLRPRLARTPEAARPAA